MWVLNSTDNGQQSTEMYYPWNLSAYKPTPVVIKLLTAAHKQEAY